MVLTSPASPDVAVSSMSVDAVGVSMRELHRSYGATRALDGMSLDIAPGELVALLGPSGCGKTTALRVLAGFETPDTGTVTVGDADVTSVPANKRNMGMVFQAYSLFPNLDVAGNVAFGMRLRRVDGSKQRARSAELLELVGLAGLAKRYPHELSGGQQQRVALARALAVEPRVLLLDEPLSALDAQVRLTLRDEIRSLQTRLGITTLFVTHDQDEALSIADRVGVMRGGRLEQIAAPEVVYGMPSTAFVAEFVGTINRLPGRLLDDGTVEVFGQRLPVLNVGAGDVPQQKLTGDVDVLVRPEAVTLTVVSDPAAGGSAHVQRRTFLGAVTRLQATLAGGGKVIADTATSDAGDFTIGAAVSVRLAERPVLLAPRT